MTKSGPIVVLTSHTSILDTFLLEKLADKGIEKFIATSAHVHVKADIGERNCRDGLVRQCSKRPGRF